MAKALTFDQVAERKRKAEQFVRDVKGNEERADEIADESVQGYAARRHFDIVDNPERRSMANGEPTRQDLLDQIADLKDENDFLQSQLDSIADVLDQGGEEDDEDEDDDDDDDGS